MASKDKRRFIVLLVLFSTLFVGEILVKNVENVTIVSKTQHVSAKRRVRWSSPIRYYDNHVANFRLQLSGDIECNPGSTCPSCNKVVKNNHKRCECICCHSTTHAKCTKTSTKHFNARIPRKWTCSNCLVSYLPFRNVRDLTDMLSQDRIIESNYSPLHDESRPSLSIRGNLSIFHLNTQSMLSSFAEFTLLVETYKMDIITLSETWLKDDPNVLQYVTIPGYQFIYKNRDTKRGGGVGLYIKDTIKYKERKDIQKLETTIEHIWIEIAGKNRNNKLLLGTFYQPDSDTASKTVWIDKLESLLSKINSIWDGSMVLAGDTNINLLSNNVTTDKYQQLLSLFNLKNVINEPTRSGKTLIDHIITNIPDKIVSSGVIPCETVSDHDSPYINVKIPNVRYSPRYKFIRSYKNFDLEKYQEDFEQIPFHVIYNITDPDEKLEVMNNLILKCIEAHAPLKRCKMTRPPAPWMRDLQINELQSERNYLRKKAHQTKLEKDWTLFRNVRNKLKTKIRETKRLFYKKALSCNRPKEVWSTINRILKPRNRTIAHDPDELNEHFNTVATHLTNLKSKTNSELHAFIDGMPTTRNTDFAIQETNYSEIKSALENIRNDCSAGYDNIPINLLKPVSNSIISPLVHIINTFIEHKSFPEAWKTARISPIPKIESPSKPSDFRPISVLPILSKVFERIVLNQLVHHIESLYQNTQHGFRKSRSTVTCLLKLRDDILRAMDRGEVTIAVFADYSKAFDTIDYNILISKLAKLKFSKTFLHWITEYLTNRKHFVQINDKSSSLLNTTFGVPQGSILGPVIFNLYVTDMSTHLKSSESLQYADDTTLYTHCKPAQLQQQTNHLATDLSNLKNWSSASNLVFNGNKTKAMLFSTKQMSRLHKLNVDRNISCDDEQFLSVKTLKILGITFNQHLEWTHHINNVIKSCYSTLKALKQLKRIIPFKLKCQLINSLVLSKLNYGNSIYTRTTPLYLLNRLQKLQNAAAGFVVGRYGSINDVIGLSWLPIIERYEYSIAILAFKAIHYENIPSNIKVERKEDRRILRSNSINTGILLHSSEKVNTFQNEAKTVFNNLPKSARNCSSLFEFKSKIKAFLLDKAISRSL